MSSFEEDGDSGHTLDSLFNSLIFQSSAECSFFFLENNDSLKGTESTADSK